MPSLSSHANVWSSCLAILRRKGCQLRIELDPADAGGDAYVAEKDGFVFVADNPIELLGLLAIYEEVRPPEDRPYWWAGSGSGRVQQELIDEAVAAREAREEELGRLRLAEPEAWVLSIRSAIENSGGVADAAAQLGISEGFLKTLLGDPLLTLA